MPGQLVARNVHFQRGPDVILAGISLTVVPGDRIGIVGPNGVGKTTLLRLLAGQLAPASGVVERQPAALAVDLLAQEPQPRPGETVRAQLRRQTGAAEAEAALAGASAALADGSPDAAERYDVALERYLRSGAADIDARIDEVLVGVGLAVALADRATAVLSGGESTKVGLAAVLLARGDVMLLDEPTNNVDREGLRLLSGVLSTTPSGVVLVSHDRAFLADTVSAVVEIDEHSRTAARFDGGWDAYVAERVTARRHAEEAFTTFSEQRQRLADRAQREREWATQGVKKAKKNPPDNDKNVRNFKIAQSEQLASRARRTEQAMARLAPVDKPFEGWELRLQFATAGRSGDVVSDLAGVVVERGSFTMGPVTMDLRWGERVSIAGRNGSGKTTLLATLFGDVEPTSGTARLGPGVVVGRLDQARVRFAAQASVLDVFMAETGVVVPEARSALAKLGIDAAKLARPAADLSPGERTRAVLAAFATSGVNVLVLDEPTNHLDLPAIEQLEAAVDRFDGTVVVVSHDQAFLEHLRTDRTISMEDGQVTEDRAT